MIFGHIPIVVCFWLTEILPSQYKNVVYISSLDIWLLQHIFNCLHILDVYVSVNILSHDIWLLYYIVECRTCMILTFKSYLIYWHTCNASEVKWFNIVERKYIWHAVYVWVSDLAGSGLRQTLLDGTVKKKSNGYILIILCVSRVLFCPWSLSLMNYFLVNWFKLVYCYDGKHTMD